MDVVFFGSGAFGLPVLERLVEVHAVRAIVTQPDRPAGRGGRPAPTPIGHWAASARPDIPVLRPESVNEPASAARIRGVRADAWVVIAFGQKLSPGLLTDRFAINLHGSLLPRWRGAAPINAAILAGDRETGNSVITLADRMDAGLVLAQSRREIDPALTAGELHDALSADGPALVERVLEAKSGDALRPRTQDESLATRAPKLSRADGWVDFAESAEACRRRVHGLTPWPGVAVGFRGESLKLLRVRPQAGDAGREPPGAIIDAREGLIACGEGVLRVLEVQRAGRRAGPWEEWARGMRVRDGERLEGGRSAC